MRAQDEIVAQIKATEGSFLTFTPEVLVPYLDYENAKAFLKPEVTAETWRPEPLTEESVKEAMREYMGRVGWEKVMDHRGISAGRTVEKMGAWLWLLGDDEMVAFAEDSNNYPQYGAPILMRICEKYGFPFPQGEDVARMARGEPCDAACEGCSAVDES